MVVTSTPAENSFFRAYAAVLWIRIRIKSDPDPDLNPHQREKLVQDPDPYQRDKLNPDSNTHQFADDKPKCMEIDPFRALFQGFEPLFASQDPNPVPQQSER